jgi:hypothetical protein
VVVLEWFIILLLLQATVHMVATVAVVVVVVDGVRADVTELAASDIM